MARLQYFSKKSKGNFKLKPSETPERDNGPKKSQPLISWQRRRKDHNE